MYNIDRKRETTKWLPMKSLNNHSTVQSRMVIFYLLKIITNAIIKAIAMIVTPTNPKNSRYIICNNKVSIAPPRFPTDVTV